MAYPVAVGSRIAVTIRSILDSQVCLNVLHYQLTDGAVTTDYEALMTQYDTWFAGLNGPFEAIQQATSEDVTYESITYQAVYPTRLVAQVFPLTDTAGAIEERALPVNVAGVIEKKTQYASRWGRGSIHLAGFPVSAVQGSQWTEDQIPLMQEIANKVEAFVMNGPTVIGTPVLFHAPTPEKPDKPATPQRTTPLYGTTVMGDARVMRRRTLRVGI